MNYYEHHIGDYAEATQHLTILEDGVYTRLLRKYYASEKPLPADIAKVQRLVVARSKEEREAVEAVLREFFELREDGWHQDRCDMEIERYRAGEPDREAKKANEDTRTRRHREERAALFKQLNDAGQHAQWNIGIKDLRALVAALQPPVPDAPETQPATEPETPETLQVREPVTAPAMPVTATQTPDTTTHTQTPTKQGNTSLGGKPEYPPGFVRFWSIWPKHPRKEAKGECAKAWEKAGAESIADTVIAHVERKKVSKEWTKDSGEYVPAPLVYLNQKRWQGADEPAADGVSPEPNWFEVAGFGSQAEALNARCHVGNFRDFRDGKLFSEEVTG